MEKTRYISLLQSLVQNQKPLVLGQAFTVQRDCFDRVAGQLDPRADLGCGVTRQEMAEHPERFEAEYHENINKLCGPENPERYDSLNLMRYCFGWRTQDQSPDVATKIQVLSAPQGDFQVRQYEVPTHQGDRPCMVFIHGGGFVAGDVETVENQCRLLAKRCGGVVLSVDYPLAPEHPFPCAFDACYATVEWAFHHAAQLGISPLKIGVSGDSAGGNLALACALRDRDEGKGMIHYQGLIYPLLSRAENPQEPHYYWKPELYDNPHHDPKITDQISVIGRMTKENNVWVVPQEMDKYHPYLSPIMGNPAGLPKTLMMTVEYDFLRAECDVYTEILYKAGVPVRAIRYGGLYHGLFDRLGLIPQVEDMLCEMAEDLKAL